MSRRSRIPAFAAVLFVLPFTGNAGTGNPERQERPAPITSPPEQGGPLPGGLKLRNGSPIPLTVEIRVGLDEECDSATLIGTHTLAPGRFLVIHSSQPLCVRREVAVGGVAQRQGWEKKTPMRGLVEEVVL
jgi:hypothetical protein